ncbi:Glucan endo-1,3-beta-glucosidase, basic vacuolar isoform [Morella rubra]|uniref:glucan endo-1,3-beta-D-glucosidase n=1 Tax=Morella rubra TaxID=262757 RepID=A0A6A1WRW4_9ROSI|nr:Glucan endo-1,3-beta-glucosidase, basic vacuolar isoform [Morella rubra]
MALFKAKDSKVSMAPILLLLGFLISGLELTGAQVGVCYGRNGNNLPAEGEVIALYKSNGIGRMRLYEPYQPTLDALKGSNIELIIGIGLNSNLQALTDAAAATDWVQKNIKSYSPDVRFKYIAVGNEVHPNDAEAKFVLPAMQSIHNAIVAANLQDQIKVSTAIDTTLLSPDSFPPSKGAFSASSYINPIVSFLVNNGAPLLANVYPYFSYTGDLQNIALPYALFTSPGVVVTDPEGNRGYQNLFDALLDTLYSAVEKAGGPNLQIVVSESGWPSEGGTGATVENAGTYYKNLIGHVKSGTPKKPGQAIETYLFAMFDENIKNVPPEVERHFGLFSPNKQPKYQLTFG